MDYSFLKSKYVSCTVTPMTYQPTLVQYKKHIDAYRFILERVFRSR